MELEGMGRNIKEKKRVIFPGLDITLEKRRIEWN